MSNLFYIIFVYALIKTIVLEELPNLLLHFD